MMWKLTRTIRIGLIVGAALAVTAAPVLASTAPTGTLSGFEDAIPTTTCGVNTGTTPCQTASFAGYFSATPYRYSGFWTATVEHEGLPTPSTASTSIVGGSFTLDTLSGAVLSGSDMTGTIWYDGAPSMSFFGCTQTYKVKASIAKGGLAGSSAIAYLTHYGTGESGGSCTGIYFATISGDLTL